MFCHFFLNNEYFKTNKNVFAHDVNKNAHADVIYAQAGAKIAISIKWCVS